VRNVRDLRRLKVDGGSGVDAQLKALELMKSNSSYIMEKADRYKRVGTNRRGPYCHSALSL
jgi:hypothetical protein